VLNTHGDAGSSKRREHFVQQLCEMTGLIPHTPIPRACRQCPVVFFRMMEDCRRRLVDQAHAIGDAAMAAVASPTQAMLTSPAVPAPVAVVAMDTPVLDARVVAKVLHLFM
jgi:hypothetical protein